MVDHLAFKLFNAQKNLLFKSPFHKDGLDWSFQLKETQISLTLI